MRHPYRDVEIVRSRRSLDEIYEYYRPISCFYVVTDSGRYVHSDGEARFITSFCGVEDGRRVRSSGWYPTLESAKLAADLHHRLNLEGIERDSRAD